jgi:HTH-type transcriptional regulator/antitoxin HigA
MEIKPIKTEADYENVLARIDTLMSAESGSPEGDELEILVTLVQYYEQANYPIGAPDPVEFLKNVMEFRGLRQTGLADILHSRSRASEILNKQRPLTLGNIRQIAAAWHIPADPLITEYDVIHDK